jgi:hypothetical protein
MYLLSLKLFQKKFDQKRRDGVINRKLFQKKFDQNPLAAVAAQRLCSNLSIKKILDNILQKIKGWGKLDWSFQMLPLKLPEGQLLILRY